MRLPKFAAAVSAHRLRRNAPIWIREAGGIRCGNLSDGCFDKRRFDHAKWGAPSRREHRDTAKARAESRALMPMCHSVSPTRALLSAKVSVVFR
jgi:hypothetical protein